jgi:hypothetical protein
MCPFFSVNTVSKQIMAASFDPAASFPSPSSPSQQRLHHVGATARVGGENIAALRERMSQIQFAYNAQLQPTNRRSVTLANTNKNVVAEDVVAVSENEEVRTTDTTGPGAPLLVSNISKMPVFSPPYGDDSMQTGSVSNLEAIQRRIRDLGVK